MPTAIEIENGIKVFEMLTKIEDVDVIQKKEDIFLVTEPESGLNLFIDVEEKTIIFLMDICQAEEITKELGELLLCINNESAVHGAYGFDKKKKRIVFKDVLEIKNLDQNELQGSIESMILTVSNSISKISEIIGGQ